MCDVRRFEEQYPFTALPDRNALRQGQAQRTCQPPPPLAAEAEESRRTDSSHVPAASAIPKQHLLPVSVGSSSGPESVGGGPSQSAGASRPFSSSSLWHVYEIIRDGSPCRMYFDLEFLRGCNPGLDGEGLVRAWINVVAGENHLLPTSEFAWRLSGCDVCGQREVG